MARAYSQDLRDRVIDAALSGLPARHAAARFGVGIATAIVWARRARESGEATRAAVEEGIVPKARPAVTFHPRHHASQGFIIRTYRE